MRSDDPGSHYSAAWPYQNLDVAIGFGAGMGGVGLGKAGAHDHKFRAITGPRLLFRHSDPGNRRLRMNDARHEGRAMRPIAEHGIDGQLRAVTRSMGPDLACRVAGNEDALIGRAPEAAEHGHLSVQANLRHLEPQTVEIGLPSGGEQQMRARDPLFLRTGLDVQGDPVIGGGNGDDAGMLAHVQPFGAQAPQHRLGHFGVLVAERLEHFDERHLTAEPQVGLGQRQTGRAATHHDQMTGPPRHLEDGFGGEIGNPIQPGNGRHHRARSRCEEKIGCTDRAPLHLDYGRTGKARPAAYDFDTLGGEMLGGNLGTCLIDRGTQPCVDPGEVDARLLGANAEIARRSDLVGPLGGGGQGLGGQRAPIVRNPAQFAPFDQHHARIAGCSPLGGGDPGRAGSNDAKIDPVVLRHAHRP